MAKYRNKPNEVDATQWWKMGDHPEVTQYETVVEVGLNGEIVSLGADEGCKQCIRNMGAHGRLAVAVDDVVKVCPGDYLYQSVTSETRSASAKCFEEGHELIEEELPNLPQVRFTTKKGDPKALSKFMDAVKELIVEYSDTVGLGHEYECSLILNMEIPSAQELVSK